MSIIDLKFLKPNALRDGFKNYLCSFCRKFYKGRAGGSAVLQVLVRIFEKMLYAIYRPLPSATHLPRKVSGPKPKFVKILSDRETKMCIADGTGGESKEDKMQAAKKIRGVESTKLVRGPLVR